MYLPDGSLLCQGTNGFFILEVTPTDSYFQTVDFPFGGHWYDKIRRPTIKILYTGFSDFTNKNKNICKTKKH